MTTPKSVEHHLVAAWTAGHIAGTFGVPRRQGAEDYARQVAPLVVASLGGDDGGEGAAVVAAGFGCADCSLPEQAHDPAVGMAGHGFRAFCTDCRAIGCTARQARCSGECRNGCHHTVDHGQRREAEPVGVT